MSKSKGNTVDPFALFDKYGADVARWYLLYTSPAWSPTRFDEDGVMEIQSKYFGTLRNVYNFFVLYSNTDDIDLSGMDVPYAHRSELDRWVLSKYNRLVRDVTADMDNYEHMKAVKKITEFVSEDLSNWYIRRARRRFYAEEMTEDKQAVFLTTYELLKGVALLSAPFAPFLSDEIYTKLTGEESVHLAFFPKADESLIDDSLEEKMELVRTVVTLGRGEREKEKIKVRQPLREILLDSRYEAQLSDMKSLIMEELNVKDVVFEKEMDTYLDYVLKPDFRKAGPVLGKKVNEFGKALAAADAKEMIAKLGTDGKILLRLGGEETEIPADLVDVRVTAKEGFAVGTERGVFVLLDTQLSPELLAEGLARELVSKVQQLRKQKDFDMMDHIELSVTCDEEAKEALEAYRDYIMKETLSDSFLYADGLPEEYSLNGHKAGISVRRLG